MNAGELVGKTFVEVDVFGRNAERDQVADDVGDHFGRGPNVGRARAVQFDADNVLGVE